MIRGKNFEGYLDPTVCGAMISISRKKKEKLNKLLRAIFNLCEVAGFQIQGRIVLLDKETGKVWR
ncbi:MAG: hypothetical protein LBR74_03710 [Eubacterium sp.]|jgi:nitrate reductase NapAB chaperone NapD|nr:hypothetical protein [Eubacterium sp.]